MQLPYESRIYQISRLVHGASERSRFAMFKAYMDEAGIQRSDPYCVIAGYVGDVREWDAVDRKWEFVLDDFKAPYFHSLEFYGKDEKKVYVGWKPSKRLAFQNALFDCLRDSEVWLVSSAVDVQVFLSLTEDERRFLTGGMHNGFKWKKQGAPTKPYFVPFHETVIQSASHTPVGEQVWPVMSWQEQYEPKALELYKMMLDSDPPMQCRPKLGTDMVYSEYKRTRPLQAADLAAYWSGKMMRYRAKFGNRNWANFRHRVEIQRLLERMKSWSDLKLFNFQGMMMLLQFSNRFIKTSFPTLDQALPSLPAAQRNDILSIMRKVNFREFVHHWKPDSSADHG